MLKKNGAEIVVHLLERQGVTMAAGIPGGMNLPLYDALGHSRQIRHILTRHEQGAGFIAQGMARASGRAGVCLATSGPGATNLLTAIADARADSIPVIAITGQVPHAMLGSNAFQEVDMSALCRPITKAAFQVRRAEELLEVIPKAFSLACSGRPGPVAIDIPKDVQLQSVNFADWPEPGRLVPTPAPDHESMRLAAKLIQRAQRPLMLLGGGVIHAQASALAVSLAEKASLPCAASLMGLSAMPSTHPLSLGLLGMHGSRYANLALEECDLLIAAGTRFGDRTTGKLSHFCPQAKVIHMDIDAAEINKLKTADLAMVGNLANTLGGLLEQVQPQPRHYWLSQIADLKQQYPLYAQAQGLEPAHVIRQIGALADPDAIIVTDVGQHQMWAAQNFPHRQPRCWLTSSGLGTMGFGLPAAIGASLAYPERMVICFSGDGSLLMNIQELATLAEEKANVKIILFDNQSLGMVRQQQELFYQQRFFASHFKQPTDFIRVAGGFGIRTFSLAGDPDHKKLFAQALALPGPCLVRVPIDAGHKVFPMVPPGAPNREMLEKELRAIKY